MRRSIICLAAMAGMLATASIASAADVGRPVDTNYRSGSYAVPYTWTGFRIGAFVGSVFKGKVDENPMPTGPYGTPLDTINPKGTFGGLEVVYDYQFNNRVVLGAAADMTLFGNVSGNRVTDWCPGAFGFSCSETQSVKLAWLSTVRGRIGYAFDNFLVYGTGGLAVAKVNLSSNYTFSSPWWGSYSSLNENTRYAAGWALGGGIDWMFARNWVLSGEYLYVNLGIDKSSSTCSVCTPVSSKTDASANIARVKLSYQF